MNRLLQYLFIFSPFFTSINLAQTPVSQSYNCSGSAQSFVVPSCVTSLTIEAWGAGGAGGGMDTYSGSPGGGGSYVTAVLSVSPGQLLTVVTGCGGQPGGGCQAGTGAGAGGFGLGDGGSGGYPGTVGCSGPGGGGGGGTGILSGSIILLVAGGGGGGGGGGNYGGGASGGGGDQNGIAAPGASAGLLAASGSTMGAAGATTSGDGAGGGGGGGGLIGGGGGGVPGTDYGGSGGAGGTSSGGTILTGSGQFPGNPGSANLCAGCASGGNVTTPGGNGLLIISYLNVLPPVVTANASANPICAGSQVTLNGSGATSYAWTGSVTNGLAFSPGSTATYTVTGTTGVCSGTAAITVTVNPLPVVNVNSAVICAGQQTTLTASGAVSYAWANGGGLSAVTGSSVIANPAATTVYTITGTDANNCTSSNTTTVTVNPLPNITVNSATICAGQQTAALTANGAVSYNWSPITGLSAASGANVNASPASTTIYTITGTNINSCSSFTTATVTVNALPTITVSSGVICSAGSATLVAGGGSSYAWSPGTGLSSTSGSTVIASPPSITVYTVTGTDANACTNVATTTVTVNSPPTLNVNSAVICIGQQTAILSANGANTYVWSPSSGLGATTGSSVSANPVSTTVYTITGTAVNGCTASLTSTVTVNPLPVLSANSAAICLGQQTATLNANGATTYTWNPVSGLSSTNAQTVTASPGVTTIYTLTGTDANTCTNVTTCTVTVNSLPVLSVNSSSICSGQQTATLNITGANTYTWSPASGLNSTSGPNVTASPATTIVYTIDATDLNTCTNTITSTVTVNQPPTLSVNSGSICAGQQSITLQASGATTYSWNPATGLNGAQGATLTANPNTTTIYTISGTDVNTCTASITSTVTVFAPPVVNVNSAAICKNQQTATLTATGAANYNWLPTAGLNLPGSSQVIASPIVSVNYTVTGTDANSCTNTAVAFVTVNPIPAITANSGSICRGQSMTLIANGGVTYTWSPATGLSGTTGSNITANPAATSVYTIEGTDANTCTNVATSTVIVNNTPTVTATSTAICLGQQTAALIASGAVSYSWFPTYGLNTGTGAAVAANPTISTTYIVSGTAAGCTGTALVTVTVNPLPSPTISPSNASGCVPLCVGFSDLSGTAGAWDWSFGDGVNGITGTPTHCYYLNGDFTVNLKLIDANGCKNYATAAVKVFPKPVADFVYNPLKPHIGQDDEVTFTDASYGANITNWSWFIQKPEEIIDTVQNPKITYTQIGDYIAALVVTTDHGCMDTTYKVISVNEDYALYVPNAFSPNGDGRNEIFMPKGLGFTKYSITIFDRWGEQLFESTDLEKGWDGTYQKRGGEPCPNDSYIYKIRLETIYGEQKEILGHVTILR